MELALMAPVDDHTEGNSSRAAANAEYDDEVDKFFRSLPPGERFRPYEFELLKYYLHPKINNLPLPKHKIADVDIYKYCSWELADKYKSYGEGKHYFFTPRDKKYLNGIRPNRAAGDGYWKATGSDTAIYEENGGKKNAPKRKLGSRKVLAYYTGKAPRGIKTNWIMREYVTVAAAPQPPREQVKAAEDKGVGKKARKRKSKDPAATSTIPEEPKDMKLDDWVLCKIYYKQSKRNTEKRQNSSSAAESHEAVDDQDMDIANANVEEPTIEISDKKSKKSAGDEQQHKNSSCGAASSEDFTNMNNGNNVDEVRNFPNKLVSPPFQQLTDPHHCQSESVRAVQKAMVQYPQANWDCPFSDNALNISGRHYSNNAPSLAASLSGFDHHESLYSMMASSSSSDHYTCKQAFNYEF